MWAVGSGSPGRGAAPGLGEGSTLPERPRQGPQPLLLALLTQVYTTRAAWVRINLYYQVSQTLQKPQPDQGRLVPGTGRARESQATGEPSILPLQQEAWPVSCRVGLSNALWGTLGDKEEVAALPSTGQRCWACSSMQEGLFPSLPGLLLSLLRARQSHQEKRRKLLFSISRTI